MTDDPQLEFEEMEDEPAEEESAAEESLPIKTPRRRKSSKSTKKSSGGSEEVKPEAEMLAEPAVEVAPVVSVSQAGRIDVRSLWPARLVAKGDVTPSGETYVWPNAGALVAVNPVDVEFLMAKNRAGKDNACCGGGPRNYFELA